MIVAQKIKYDQRTEYLLYLWQIEDLIRSYDCNFERLKELYLSQFKVIDEEQRAALEAWYENLCLMMVHENKKESGHLQVSQNVLIDLTELHNSLMSSHRFSAYEQAYYQVLPYIVELRAHDRQQAERTNSKCKEVGELETLFNLLYGVLLLRLQHKVITEATEKAAQDVSAFMRLLSRYYKENRENPLDFD